MIDRLLRVLRGLAASKWGLLAQLLTFASVFLPVIFGLTDAVAFMLQASAVSMIVVNSATLVAAVRLPTEKQDSLASEIIGSALVSLLVVTLIMGTVCSAISAWANIRELALLGWGAAAITFAQGLYLLYVADRTRKGDYSSIMNARFGYGAGVFVLTLLACLTAAHGLFFVLGNAIAFLLPVGIGATMKRDRSRTRTHGPRLPSVRGLGRQIVVSRTLSLSYVLGGVASQAGALSLGSVGAMQGAWAVILRIAGGFSTIGLQLAGPGVDIRVARARRNRATGALLFQEIARGSLIGIILSVCVVIVATLGVLWTGAAAAVDTPLGFVGLVVAGLGYAAVSAILSPISRSLGMVGPHRLRLLWDSTRAALSVACIFLFTGAWLLIALGFLGVFTSALYIVLCWHATRSSHGEDPADEPPAVPAS